MTALQVGFLAAGLAVDLALAALPLLVWFVRGRDPHFTDDDSVLMPSPPPELTPALASVVMAGQASRRTVAAGLMDLAGRELIEFKAESFPIGHRAGLALTVHRPHNPNLPVPEEGLYDAIKRTMAGATYIPAIMLGNLSYAFAEFTRSLDEVAVVRGWAHVRSGAVIRNWRILALAEMLAGVFAVWIAWLIDPSVDPGPLAIAIVGIGFLVAGAVTLVVSSAMPARTPEGAMLAAMLNAYRRTLKATIAQAQSLEQVVVMRPLPWVDSPTEEIAWAVAFGLDRQIDSLLSQSLEVSQAGGWPSGIRDWFSII